MDPQHDYLQMIVSCSMESSVSEMQNNYSTTWKIYKSGKSTELSSPKYYK